MKMKYRFISAICAAFLSASVLSVTAYAAGEKTWQSAYSAFLKEEAKTDKSGTAFSEFVKGFSIYDLDNNGIPELIYSSNGDKFSDTRIYTYNNGKMLRLTVFGIDKNDTDFWSNYGYIGFSPETGEIVNYSTGTGVSYSYFKLINNKLVFQFETSYGGRTVDVPQGTWKGEDISDNEYFERLWKRYPKGMMRLGRDFSLSDAEIRCAVYGYGNYKKTYKAYLSQLKKRTDNLNSESNDYTLDYSFYIKDLTGDSVPELIIKCLEKIGGTVCPKLSVFTIKDNRLTCAMRAELSSQYFAHDSIGKSGDFIIGYNKPTKQLVVMMSYENMILDH